MYGKQMRSQRRIIPVAAAALLLIFGFEPRVAHAQLCRHDGGPGGPQCQKEDCSYEGGKAECTEPMPVPPGGATRSQADPAGFQYDMCGGANYVSVEAQWCVAAGGTWNGPTDCAGLPPVVIGGGGTLVKDNDAANQISDKFVAIHSAPCPILSISDSGWNDYYNDGNCATVLPDTLKTHSKTLVLASGRTRTYNVHSGPQCNQAGGAVIVINERRNWVCPKPYQARVNANNEFECFKPMSCGPSVGNPICTADGVKRQTENDYASGGIGGLQFDRYFNSGGYYHPNADTSGTPTSYRDYWRHTYDRRILAAPINPYTIASAQRPDGTVEDFDLNGHATQNFTGAADLLEPIVTGGATTGWKLTLADASVETYDAAGRLLTITARQGLVTSLAYGANGFLSTVTDQFGHQLKLAYDGSDRLQTMTDPAKNAYSYGYDADGRLASVTYPGNRTRIYLYEDTSNADFITGIIDENHQRYASFGYDAAGHGISTQHGEGANLYQFAYNWNGTQVTDPLGATRNYSFVDSAGLYKTQSITQHGVTSGDVSSSFTYDANGNIATRTDFNGNQTRYVFDQTRNLETSRTEGLTATGDTTSVTRTITTQWHPTFRLPTQVTQPSGLPGVNRVTRTTYNGRGAPLTKTITAGTLSRKWAYTYDAYGRVATIDGPRTDVVDVTTNAYYPINDACEGCRGQLKTVTDAAGHVTTYAQYDADSRVTQIVDPNGIVRKLTYDPRGWLLTRTEAVGTPQAETTTIGYDDVGQITRVTRPDGSYLAYQYDSAHRLTDIADSAGDIIQYTLDAMGNHVHEQVLDPQDVLRRSQKRVYDDLNRLLADVGAYGESTQFGYDDNGNRIAELDAAGALTTSAFDPLNRLISSIDPANGTTTRGYDAADNLTSVKDATGLTTTYGFNALGDPISLSSPDTGVTAFGVDSAGNRATQTDARNVLTTNSYDALNRRVQSVAGTGPSAVTLTYAYDQGPNGIGRLASITGGGSTLQYGYDPLGRITQKTETVGTKALSVAYGYAAGVLKTLTYPSGAVVSYSRDGSGRISGITMGGQTVVSNVKYQPFGDVDQYALGDGTLVNRPHDLESRIEQVTLGPDPAIADAAPRSYSYDVLNRMTNASLGPAALTYGYDAIGDRVQESVNGVQTTFSYQPATHRLSGLSGGLTSSYGYDAAGNQTSRGATTLDFDARGRFDAVSGAAAASYVVNARSERVQKTSAAGTTRFIYDEKGRLLGEYDANLVPIQEYIYLNQLPVAVLRTQGAARTVYPIYTDQLGTPRAVADPARHVDVWRWDIAGSAFGDHAANADPDGDGTAFAMNLRFPGQYFDAETNLHYNYFRDYEPATGRFIESDPVGLKAGMSTYSYTSSSPLRYADPKGLTNWSFQWGIGGGGSVYIFGASVYTLHVFDPISTKSCSYTVYCGGFDVGIEPVDADFGLTSPITKWDDGRGECGTCDVFSGYGSEGNATAEVGIGFSLGGWLDVPNGPHITGDFINLEYGAVKIGTGINLCRFSLN